ncbi:MAG: hypothetical protein ABI673_11385 [Novosphingobium sp.]
MMEFARWVIRNRVLVIAAFAVAIFMTSGYKQPAQPANAWSAAPPAGAAETASYGEPKQQTFGQAAGKALVIVAKQVGVEKALPADLVDQTKGNWAAADDAVKTATASN